jgi:hypothetical protein
MSQSTALVRTMDDVSRFSTAVAQSGMYKDMRTAAEAAVKLGIATELGLGLIGMSTVHIVEGKPTLGYQAMLTLVRRSGRYDYRITHRDDQRCSIEWLDRGDVMGTTEWTIQEAERVGLTKNRRGEAKTTWSNYPRMMLTARAVSEGVNAYCPDVMGGAVYTPDEMGAEVGEDGNIVVLAAEVVKDSDAGGPGVALPPGVLFGASDSSRVAPGGGSLGEPAAAALAEPVAAPRVVEPEQAAAPAPHPPAGEVVRFISKAQQKELAAAAKKAGATWDGLKHWLASEHQIVVERQADLSEAAFHLAVAFCNETSWAEEIAAAEVVEP